MLPEQRGAFHCFFAVSDYIGDREYMEDAYSIRNENEEETGLYFGVYDGHCGSQASRYLREHLGRACKEGLSKGCKSKLQWEETVIKVHEDDDRQFLAAELKQREASGTDELYCGSTSISLFVKESKLQRSVAQ